ncbi:MAG: rod shape-determining protein RodA [Rickettsiaceae bacterium]|nr:rod shape-determining protein RodA [Rickettsiaceae bacterium]
MLALYGFLILYSASSGSDNYWLGKQVIISIFFLAISFLLVSTDTKIIYNLTYPFFIINLLLLLLVYKFGHSAMGATRWINIFGLKIQPSELCKISILLFLARYFHDLKIQNRLGLRHVILPIIICAIPIFFILIQPDLGTAIITAALTVTLIFIVGFDIKYFVASFVLLALALPILWQKLHTYQKQRLLTFLNPELDLLGAGYNIHQSKIAIGSGGFWGKGLIQGSQSHLSFLPEFHTDFAFALLAEELGFVGVTILILLYLTLISLYFIVAFNCANIFGKILVMGTATMLFLHCFINIAMVMGMMPVVGVPLPFISYGGTMTAVMLISTALVINVAVNSSQKF